MSLAIAQLGQPVLRYIATEVSEARIASSEFQKLLSDMYATLPLSVPDRVSVDMANGTAKRFMAKAKILTPLVSVQQVKAMLKSGEVFAFFDKVLGRPSR